MRIALSLAVTVGLLSLASAGGQPPANPLFEKLVTAGLEVPGGPPVKLPVPLARRGVTDPDELLEQAAGRLPVSLFVKKSTTAPFSLDIESVEDADGERRGQRIDLKFIAYGDLKSVAETDFIQQLLAGKQKGGEGSDEPEPLDAAQLKERGIEPLAGPGLKESYATTQMALLERVQVKGVTRTVRASSGNSVTYATKMDERFRDDPEHPNRWREIVRTAEEDRLGPPQPYTGLGGYVTVTELSEPAGALLVELQFVLHEPPEWFGGRNLLRSKLPIVIQDNVRAFRRKLNRE